MWAGTPTGPGGGLARDRRSPDRHRGPMRVPPPEPKLGAGLDRRPPVGIARECETSAMTLCHANARATTAFDP